jgi:hypothetical protein
LVVRELVHVLHALGNEEGDGGVVEVHVYPGRDLPVLWGNEF